MMNAPKKYVVSSTLQKPIWRLGGHIVTDGSSQLVRTLLAHDLVDELHLLVYPLTLGRGKRIWSDEARTGFTLRSATPYPTGVVGLDYARQR